MTALQDLAKEASAWFTTKKRHEDDENEIVVYKEGAPEWIKTMAREAHGDMLPDDYRFRFIVEALDALEQYDDPESARNEIEADVYTSELTSWLASRNDRLAYCDEADNQGDTSDRAGNGTDTREVGSLWHRRKLPREHD